MNPSFVMATGKLTGLLAAALLLTTGCSDTCCDETAELRVGTFNTGLAPIDVPNATERAPAVIQALAEQELDLICVQELWLETDWDALVSATSELWPYTERLPAEPVDALCAPSELEPLQLCVESACPEAAGEDLSDCAIESCVIEVAALSPGCAGCLIAEVEAGSDIADLRTNCLGGSETDDVEAFIYNGGYDTGILTSLPIHAQESLVLDSYLVRASVNYAHVDTALGELHVFCTHLASAISTFEYRGDFADWKAEQARQIAQLLDFIDQKAADSDQVIVLGDLNTGPTIDGRGISPEWPDHYDMLIESGLTNPYAESAEVECTDCPDNTFHSADSDAKLIDHILLRGFDGHSTTDRFMTGLVTISVDGQDVLTNISDHYGLVMTLSGEAR